jgi:tellurite resistance protein TerC
VGSIYRICARNAGRGRARSGWFARPQGQRQEAAAWSIVWVLLALGFDYGLWIYLTETVGREAATAKAMEFLTGYVIEKSLSVDNVFVFLMIFTHFGVPPQYQRKVLLYGVLGAIVMRIIMVLAAAGWSRNSHGCCTCSASSC